MEIYENAENQLKSINIEHQLKSVKINKNQCKLMKHGT